MQMEDRLAGAGANVIDRPIAFLNAAFARDPGCDQLAIAQQFRVGLFCFLESHNVLLGNDQYVGRRLRVDIFEGKAPVILIHFFGRDLTGNDLAEKAVSHKLTW